MTDLERAAIAYRDAVTAEALFRDGHEQWTPWPAEHTRHHRRLLLVKNHAMADLLAAARKLSPVAVVAPVTGAASPLTGGRPTLATTTAPGVDPGAA